MVSTGMMLKEKLMFWKDFWPMNFIVYRNRGDTFSPEIVPGVRIKYNDGRHSVFKLRTGERLPGSPYRYVLTGNDGQSFVHLVEADDEQFVAFKPDFRVDPETDSINTDQLGHIELESDSIEGLDTDELKELLKDKNYDVTNLCVLEQKDEQLSFLSQEMKIKGTKYKPSKLLYEHKDLAMVMATALAVTIIIYATAQDYGRFVPVLKQLSGSMPELTNALNSATGTAPGN